VTPDRDGKPLAARQNYGGLVAPWRLIVHPDDFERVTEAIIDARARAILEHGWRVLPTVVKNCEGCATIDSGVVLCRAHGVLARGCEP
jgi:hypothetical protein